MDRVFALFCFLLVASYMAAPVAFTPSLKAWIADCGEEQNQDQLWVGQGDMATGSTNFSSMPVPTPAGTYQRMDINTLSAPNWGGPYGAGLFYFVGMQYDNSSNDLVGRSLYAYSYSVEGQGGTP